jgi:hypothetical protein
MQLSTGARDFVNSDLYHTLALGEVASPDVRYDMDLVPVAALVALIAVVYQAGRSHRLQVTATPLPLGLNIFHQLAEPLVEIFKLVQIELKVVRLALILKAQLK